MKKKCLSLQWPPRLWLENCSRWVSCPAHRRSPCCRAMRGVYMAGRMGALARAVSGTHSLFLLRRHHTFFQNFLYGGNRPINLRVGVIEVWGEADSGFGAPIDQNVALQQFPADFVRIRHVNRNRTAALFRVARRVDAPAMLICQRN